MGKEVISHYENDLRKHFNKKMHNKRHKRKEGGIWIW